MRIVIDEDIPKELSPCFTGVFHGRGIVVWRVEDLGLRGTKNGVLCLQSAG